MAHFARMHSSYIKMVKLGRMGGLQCWFTELCSEASPPECSVYSPFKNSIHCLEEHVVVADL